MPMESADRLLKSADSAMLFGENESCNLRALFL